MKNLLSMVSTSDIPVDEFYHPFTHTTTYLVVLLAIFIFEIVNVAPDDVVMPPSIKML